MANVLAHRGPDGEGSFAAEPGVAFGHRRLAIIDLSDAGIQPFASDDGQLQLLHNGEIYNYRELRQELEGRGHRFHTATDTEVVLHAYEEWGDRCVERFNGMWAIALWDGRRERLFCSRDRFGVKPFYYRFDDGRFVFASELKAFRVDSSHDAPAEPRRGARLPRAGRARPPRLDVLRGNPQAGARALARLRPRAGCGRAATGRSRCGTPRATRSERCASCSSTPSGFACAATSRSGPASRAASTRRRSRARSTTCSRPRSRTRGRSATDSERSLRTSRTQGFDERPFALEVVRKTNARPALGLVHRRGHRRVPPGDRRRPRTSRSARRASSRSGS